MSDENRPLSVEEAVVFAELIWDSDIGSGSPIRGPITDELHYIAYRKVDHRYVGFVDMKYDMGPTEIVRFDTMQLDDAKGAMIRWLRTDGKKYFSTIQQPPKQ